MRMLVAITTCAILFTAIPVASQESPETVPRELALALLGRRVPGTDPPALLVGELPPALRDRISVPAEARLLGTLAFGSGSATIALAISAGPGAALEATQSALEAKGWARPEDAPPPRGGFQRSRGDFPRYLCHDNAAVSIHASPADADVSHVLVSYGPAGSIGPCTAEFRRRPRSPFDRAPMPALYPPEGVEVGGGGTSSTGGASGSGTEMVGSSMQVRTPLGAGALVDHFDAQLRDAGWQPQSRGGEQGVAWSAWRATGEDEEPWFGYLLVIEIPESDWRSASLHLRSLAEPEGRRR